MHVTAIFCNLFLYFAGLQASRKFDDFNHLLPIPRRGIFVQQKEPTFFRLFFIIFYVSLFLSHFCCSPRKETSSPSFDYEYDYDNFDRAPGYDVRIKRDSKDCSQKKEPTFSTEYKDVCSIVYEKSCRVDYVTVENHVCESRQDCSQENGKCAILYETKCSVKMQHIEHGTSEEFCVVAWF